MSDAKAANFEWKPNEGTLTVIGNDGTTRMTFPIAGLPALGFQAQKLIAGDKNRQARKDRVGDWMPLWAPTAQTARVQTVQTPLGPRVVLIFDPETEGEFPIAFVSPKFAGDVARELGAVAAAQAKPSKQLQ